MDDQEATGTGTFDPADALDATFSAVFDALVPDENSATAGEGADATPVAEGGAGRAPAAGEEAEGKRKMDRGKLRKAASHAL